MALDRRNGHRRAADAEVRQVARSAARAYFIVLLFLVIGAFAYQRVIDHRIDTAAAATCKRLNTLRVEESNRNAQVVWAALYRAKQRESELSRSGVKQTLHRTSAAYLKASIDLMRWTPTTDCQQAVKHPGTYRPPAPVPFDPTFLDFRKVPR